MTTETKTIKARCLCGSVKHDINLPSSEFPLDGRICSCTSCRRLTGTLCHTVVFMDTHYRPDQSTIDKLTPAPLSPRVTFYFCATCGCHMLVRANPQEGLLSQTRWGVPTGTYERIEGVVKWRCHLFVTDAVDGGFVDFLPSIDGKQLERWPRWPDVGEQVPVGLECSIADSQQTDRLHGRCKCGGVEFWINRPTPGCALAEQYWPNEPPDYVSDEYLPPESETFYMRDNRTKYLAGLCACNSCRLATGMETTPWAYIPTYQITQDKDGKVPWSEDFGKLQKYTSSPGRHRYFCSGCGAAAFFSADHRRYLKDVAIGLLDAPEGPRAESWFGWRTNRVGFRDDAIPRAETFVLELEKGMREWQALQPGKDLSGSSQSAGVR